MSYRVKEIGDTAIFHVPRTADWDQLITWEQADGPVNLTGYTIELKAVDSLPLESSEFTVQYKMTTDNGRIEIVKASDGAFKLTLTDTETQNLPFDNSQFFINATSSEGHTQRLFEGVLVTV